LNFTKKKGATAKIGTNARGNLDREALEKPGPGTYDPMSDSGAPKFAFGTGKRTNMGDGGYNPGPGHYSGGDTVGDGGPAFVFGMKIQDKDRNYNPGPGAYKPNVNSSKVTTSKIGIGTSNRTGLYPKNEVPGSGAYDHDQSHVRKRDPAFGFGTGNK